MTFEELLEAAGLAGGTAPDPTGRDPGFRPPTPSLGTGTDAMTGYPRAVGGAPMAPAIEPPLRLPGPGGMPDRPGQSSFLERLATIGGLPHVPFYGGENGSTRSHPAMALLALASGALNARAKLAGADKLERLTFADSQDRQVAARKAERDEAFKYARGRAEIMRQERAKRDEARVTQMTTARREHETRLQAWLMEVGRATTDEQLQHAKRMANKEQQAITTIDRDMSNLTGQRTLQDAGVPDSEIPGLPTSAPKPPKESGEAAGGYDVFMTPSGPKMMTRAEGTAQGLLPSDIRKKRVASPGEREAMALRGGFISRLNGIKEAFSPEFTGVEKGAAFGISPSGIGERVGLMSKEETNFRSQVDGLKNAILKLQSGGAVTDGEASRLMLELPTYDMDPKAFKSRLESFQKNFRIVAESHRQNIEASDVDISKFAPLPDDVPWAEPKPKKGKKGARPNPNAPPERPPLSSFHRP